jgi:hypothetical protein
MSAELPTYWVRRAPLDVHVFRVAHRGFTATPSPGNFRRRVHPLVRFRSSPEYLELRPPRVSRRRAPSMGFRSPSRHPPPESTSNGDPSPAAFRPRRFSRPRRFPPPTALRVCFTPQPRPGFTLQGFSPPHSRTSFHPPLPSCRLARRSYRRCRRRQSDVPRLQGVHPCGDPSRITSD